MRHQTYADVAASMNRAMQRHPAMIAAILTHYRGRDWRIFSSMSERLCALDGLIGHGV